MGAYQLQAAIAACHDEAARAEDTDWPQILALYALLQRMSANPMLTLNRAVAVAMVHGPEAGLELLATLDADPRLSEHHRLAAVRGHLYEKAGDPAAAIASYQTAAARTSSIPERDYLLLKAARGPLPGHNPPSQPPPANKSMSSTTQRPQQTPLARDLV